VPFWIFHTADDTTVPVAGSDNLVNALRAIGGNPIYTRYNIGGHGTAWGRAYNPLTPLVPWMMSQRRNQPESKVAGPFITITAPTTGTNCAVAGFTLALAGTAQSPSLNTLTWKSGTTTGNLTGASSWMTNTVPLSSGTNLIQTFAKGVAHAYIGNGSTSFSDSLRVVATASTSYTAWAAQQNWQGKTNAEAADVVYDGASNLAEYGSKTSPLIATEIGRPIITRSDSMITLTYEKDISRTDLVYRVQASVDMTTWIELPAILMETIGTIQRWSASTAPEAAFEDAYLRLVIERTGP
jgi:hypothetical protein